MKSLFVVNRKRLLLECGGMLFVSIGYSILFFFNMNTMLNKWFFFSNTDIKSIFLSNNEIFQSKEYLYPGSAIRARKSLASQEPIKAELLMQTENHQGFEHFVLGEKEIAISKDIARRLRVRAGDFLYIDSSYRNTDQYVITQVMDYLSGTFSRPLSDWGLVILGYDKDFVANIRSKYICFSPFSLEEMDMVTLNSIDDTDKVILIDSFKSELLRRISLYFMGLFFLPILLYIILTKVCGNFWERYLSCLLQLGFSNGDIIKGIFLLSLIKIFIPLSLGLLIQCLVPSSAKINQAGLLIHFVLFAVLSISWFGICYRSCTKEVRFNHAR